MPTGQVYSPVTNRMIKIDGPAFKKLIKEGYIYDESTNIMTKDKIIAPSIHIIPQLSFTDSQKPEFNPLTTEDLIPKALNISPTFKPEIIVHLADIHIPINLHVKRHDEYNEVFENLYHELMKLPSNKLIIIAGDLVNTKLRTENETLIMAQNFLSRLSSIAPTIVGIGNHDFAENNLERVNSVEAICNTLPDIHVLKTTGIYTINNLWLVFNSLYDLKFIHRKDIQTTHPVYALYHGSLVGAMMDNGTLIKSPHSKRYPTITDFDGFDAVILGHVHKFQKLKPHIAYSGSLIQQNYGESIEHHGMLLWDIKTHTSTHVEIPNPYAYITLTVDKGELMEIDKDKLKTVASKYLRVRYCKTPDTTPSQLEKLETQLNTMYTIKESTYKSQDISKSTDAEHPQDNVVTLDTELQLINEMCNTDICDQVLFLHKDLHINHTNIYHVWRPLVMEFKNVFIYGNNHINRINFITGITDICAPNTHGKSSIVYTLLFTLFDKISTHSDKKTDILHKNAESGYAELLFICNGQKFHIKKDITLMKRSARNTHGALYKTQFHRINSDDTRTCLNGTSETETIKTIEKYVGTLPQFINNNLISTKQGASSILSMGPTEQTKHFHTVCNLAHYDNYLTECKKRHKTVKDDITRYRILHQDAQSRLSLLDNVKLLSDIESSNFIVTEIQKIITDLKSQQNIKQRHSANVTATINMLKSQVADFKHIPKSDLENNMAIINTKLSIYTPELTTTAHNYTLLYLQNHIDQYTNIRPFNCDIDAVEKSISDIHSQIQTMNTQSIRQDTANQKIGELRNQLKQREILFITCNETLLPVHNEPKDVLETEMITVKTAIAAINTSNYNVSQIPLLQSQTATFQIGEPMDLSVSKLRSIQDKLLIAKHQKDTFHGDRKKTTMTSEVLVELIKPLINIDIERSLSFSRLKELETLVKSFNKPKNDVIRTSNDIKYVPFDTSLVKTFDNHPHIPLFINNEYIQINKQKTLCDEYERLQTDIAHNNRIRQNIQTNKDIENHNVDITAQINWIKYQTIESNINLLTMEESKLKTYINNLNAYDALQKLIQLKTLKSQLTTITNKLSYIVCKEQLSSLRIEIADIKTQLVTYESVIQWYQKYELLQAQLKSYERQKSDHYTYQNAQNELIALRNFHDILTLEDQRKHTLLQLSMWDKTHELSLHQNILDTTNDELRDVNNKISIQEQTLAAEQKKITGLQHNINSIDALQSSLSKYNEEINILEMQSDVYSEYERLFSVSGIPSVLLKRKLLSFSKTVNDIFQKYTKYTFECRLEDTTSSKGQKIDIIICNHTNNTELEYTRLSGFESVLLNIALNKAMLDINTQFSPGVFIIDESMDCIDQDRFVKCLPTIFNILRSHFNTILVISHRDIPRDIIDNKITITNRVSYSIIE